jgi:hypothetical protein
VIDEGRNIRPQAHLSDIGTRDGIVPFVENCLIGMFIATFDVELSACKRLRYALVWAYQLSGFQSQAF